MNHHNQNGVPNQEHMKRANPYGHPTLLGVRGDYVSTQQPIFRTPVPALSFESKHQWPIEVDRFEGAVFLHLKPTRFRQTVDAQAVLGWINFVQQLAFKGFKLGKVNPTFKDRLLHALPRCFAHFRNTTKAAPAFFGLGIDVITNQNQHDGFTSR